MNSEIPQEAGHDAHAEHVPPQKAGRHGVSAGHLVAQIDDYTELSDPIAHLHLPKVSIPLRRGDLDAFISMGIEDAEVREQFLAADYAALTQRFGHSDETGHSNKAGAAIGGIILRGRMKISLLIDSRGLNPDAVSPILTAAKAIRAKGGEVVAYVTNQALGAAASLVKEASIIKALPSTVFSWDSNDDASTFLQSRVPAEKWPEVLERFSAESGTANAEGKVVFTGAELGHLEVTRSMPLPKMWEKFHDGVRGHAQLVHRGFLTSSAAIQASLERASVEKRCQFNGAEVRERFAQGKPKLSSKR